MDEWLVWGSCAAALDRPVKGSNGPFASIWVGYLTATLSRKAEVGLKILNEGLFLAATQIRHDGHVSRSVCSALLWRVGVVWPLPRI